MMLNVVAMAAVASTRAGVRVSFGAESGQSLRRW